MAKKRSDRALRPEIRVTGFGAFVRARREGLGLSLSEFCRRNGLDKGNLSRLERGLLTPPQGSETLTSYAKALQLVEGSPGWRKLFKLATPETSPERDRAKGWTTEKNLELWAERMDAIVRLPQLLRLLVRATLDNPQLVRFSAGEGVQRHGWDGIVETTRGNDFVPEGVSGWELSVEKRPKDKANRVFEQRTKETAGSDISQMTFVFVTPRKWDNKDKARWCQEKKSVSLWKDIIALDSTDLEQWLEIAPTVDVWLARRIGVRPPEGVEDLEEHWKNLRETTDPPLAPDVFTASRDDALKELRVFLGLPREPVADAVSEPHSRLSTLAFEAASPTDALDFVAAAMQSFDQDERDQIESRLVIVEHIEAWRDLCEARHRLILLAHPKLSIDPETVAEAVRRGHQILLCSERFVGDRSRVFELPAPRREALEKALVKSGVLAEEARRIADDSGRSLSVVKRLLPRFAHVQKPAWTELSTAHDLLPILLAGAWDDGNADDQAMLANLAGKAYGEVLQTANQWRQQRDPPIMRIQSTWNLVSREDSWRFLAPSLTSQQLDRFATAALEVLGADDPALTLPTEERWRSALHGKRPKFSSDLRKGLAETLVLLAAKSPSQVVPDTLHPVARANEIVRQLLPEKSTWTRWSSLSDVLPLLAEAAPDQFLSAIERDLQESDSCTLKLFEESSQGSAMFGRCYHASLLWALEVLAWSPDHLSRTALALALLADRKPGTGNWGNNPLSSLIHIFLPWLPQTTADASRRVSILKTLLKRAPDAGWRLLLNLLPQKHTASDFIHRPKWRDWVGDYESGATNSEYWEQSQQIASLVLESIGTSGTRVEDVIREIAHFPADQCDTLIKNLESLNTEAIDDESRDRIVAVLRTTTTRHRQHPTAAWTLPSELLERLEKIGGRFEPTSPTKRNAWLFQAHVELPISWTELSFDVHEDRVSAMQRQAIREVFDVSGLEGVQELVELAKSPRIVGFVLAREKLIGRDADVIPQCLSSENHNLVEFGKGFFHGLLKADGWSWLEQLPLEKWTVQQAGSVLAELPLERRTWDLLARLTDEVQTYYWQHTGGFCHEPNPVDVTFAVVNLLQHRRAIQAIDVLNMAEHRKCVLATSLVMDALEAARNNDAAGELANRDPNHIRWAIQELITHLQDVDGVDRQRLASLEWTYLSLLDGHSAEPRTLFSILKDEPSFFVDIIRLVFRSEHVHPDETEPPTEEQQHRATAAFELLLSWRDAKPPRLPGSQADGMFDEERLFAWVRKARELCRESGHLGICDSQLGEVLANDPEPAAPNTHWPSEPLRDLLEEFNSESLFRGFEIGIFNKRGITTRSSTEGGEQERELARKYRAYAAASQDEWPLIANSLRRVADDYEAQAAREDEEAKRRM